MFASMEPRFGDRGTTSHGESQRRDAPLASMEPRFGDRGTFAPA